MQIRKLAPVFPVRMDLLKQSPVLVLNVSILNGKALIV